MKRQYMWGIDLTLGQGGGARMLANLYQTKSWPKEILYFKRTLLRISLVSKGGYVTFYCLG